MTERLHRLRILFLVVAPFVAVLGAMVLLWNQAVFPMDIVLMVVFYVVTVFGVTIGFHRMLTHQGFGAPTWVRLWFLITGVMAFEGAPASWAATHIKHHAHSDEEDDPHSPLDGFWHAHMGWLFHLRNFPEIQEYAPHLLRDRAVMFVERTSIVWLGIALLVPYLIGGVTGLFWGGFVRIFLTTHVTWSVNSICHTFGHRAFETSDESRNNWLVGLLAMGEGWHNNHHAFPRNAFHGMRWWQIDCSGLVIRFLESIGLAWDVQRVSEESISAEQQRAGNVQLALARLREELSNSLAAARNELHQLYERMKTTLEGAEHSEWENLCNDTARRLEEIQEALQRSVHVKKQKLIVYRGEVQKLMAKVRMPFERLVPTSN